MIVGRDALSLDENKKAGSHDSAGSHLEAWSRVLQQQFQRNGVRTLNKIYLKHDYSSTNTKFPLIIVIFEFGFL